MNRESHAGNHQSVDLVVIHNSLPSRKFSDANPAGLNREFLEGLLTVDSSRLVSNVQTTLVLAEVNGFYFPITSNHAQYDNSYVCSPYTGMISYSLEELKNINSVAVRIAVRVLAGVMSPVLKFLKINRVACVNNAMLSTNLYPNWKGEQLTELTQKLTARFPTQAIMFRSLNDATTPALCQVFAASDYQFVPSRVLYIIDPDHRSIEKKRNVLIDFHLLRNSPLTIARHHEFRDEDDARIKALYDQLYLDKYSKYNPQFTAELIRLFRKTNQLQFIGLRDSQGILVGVIATLEMNNQFTTPIVGYDFSLPKKAGLYRILTALVIQKSLDENKRFNMSSGVGKFKKHRGAVPYLEYSAIYVKHLPVAQRWLWKTCGWMMKNIAAPLVQKYEL